MTRDANRLTLDATGSANGNGASPTMPASQLRAFTDALHRLGYDVPALLSPAGLRPSDLEDPDATVPSVALDRVIGAAIEKRRHPNLGAHVGAVTPIGAYPLLDYLVVTTDTLGGALEQLVRYFHLVCAPVRLSIDADELAVRLVVHCPNPFGAQYETSLAVHHLRAETEQRLRVSFVSLMHEPEDRRDLERLLGCTVRAPSTWTGIEFPRDVVHLPLRRRDSVLRRVLEAHAAGVATPAPVPDGGSVVAAMRAAIGSRVGPPPTLEALARQLASTPRTLQRRLAAQGLTYQRLVDITRREAAERLLADATLAIGEIGYLLGFSEPSAFHRAFKRWHDVTPQEYRSRARRAS